MRLVAVLAGEPLPQVWSESFLRGLHEIADFTLVSGGGAMSDGEVADLVRGFDVAIVGWDARAIPMDLAADAGRLRYICSYSGTIANIVPREIIEAGILVSNWGDLPAASVAEGAVTLLLAVAHELPSALGSQRDGGWGYDPSRSTRVTGLAVGVYGCGVIGRRFAAMALALGARVRVFDPYADDLPAGVERADSLDELCAWSEALVLHAGLTPETTGSVGRAQLALLPDNGIVVNTARGALIDQDALIDELATGRLRAGLDVLEPDELDAEHPLRAMANVLLTFHQVSAASWPDRGIDEKATRVLEQLGRFAAGEEPRWLIDAARYDRST